MNDYTILLEVDLMIQNSDDNDRRSMNKPFEGILGNSSELKMIEYLPPLDEIEYNITELSKDVGI